jgi:alpha-galactosidase
MQYLSDRAWTSMTNGWGPVEKDMSNGEQGTGDGRTLTLNGKTYAKGLGTHANSEVRYALNGACSTFLSDIGVDDEVGSNGSVTFQVWTDSTKVYDSGSMIGTSATKSITVTVSNAQELRLVVTDGGNGISYDHGDWANARLSCGG